MKWHHDRKGAAVVEFAIIAPMLVLMVLGAIDVGQSINVAQVVNDASREGARIAAQDTHESVADVEAGVLQMIKDAFVHVSESALENATTVVLSLIHI